MHGACGAHGDEAFLRAQVHTHRSQEHASLQSAQLHSCSDFVFFFFPLRCELVFTSRCIRIKHITTCEEQCDAMLVRHARCSFTRTPTFTTLVITRRHNGMPINTYNDTLRHTHTVTHSCQSADPLTHERVSPGLILTFERRIRQPVHVHHGHGARAHTAQLAPPLQAVGVGFDLTCLHGDHHSCLTHLQEIALSSVSRCFAARVHPMAIIQQCFPT
jgi:hypothetical protein